MGCCFCCLSEGDKVGRVLNHFPGNRVANGKADAVQRLVGRVVMAQSQGFYSPVTDSPCVWFRIRISEEWKEKYTVRVERGNGEFKNEQRVRKVWKQVVDEERFCDFYLQDGLAKVFIKGSDRQMCKVQSDGTDWGSSGRRNWTQPPPGVVRFIRQSGVNWNWETRREHRTGNYRFQEQKYEVNELVTAFGQLGSGVDPMTGAAIGVMQPVREDAIDEQFMEENEFSSWDKKSWKQMTNPPAILLSDNKEYTVNYDIAPAQNLPAYMTQYVAVGPGQVVVRGGNMTAATVAVAMPVPVGGGGGGGGGGDIDFKLKPRQREMALTSLMELKGSQVYIVNKMTESPVKMRNDFSIFGNAGLGDAAQWVVQKMDKKDQGRPVVGFRNVKHGKFLAIRGGALTFGEGGEHCEFVVDRIDQAVLLIKHNNQAARMGFRANGDPEVPSALGDGAKARFFLFDVDDVKDRFLKN